MVHPRTAVAIPATVRPLPARETACELDHTRIGLHAESVANQEPVAIHRGTLPVVACDAWRLAARVQEPLQNAIDGARDPTVCFGKAELDKAEQAPVRPLPLLIRMARIVSKQRPDARICGRHMPSGKRMPYGRGGRQDSRDRGSREK